MTLGKVINMSPTIQMGAKTLEKQRIFADSVRKKATILNSKACQKIVDTKFPNSKVFHNIVEIVSKYTKAESHKSYKNFKSCKSYKSYKINKSYKSYKWFSRF